MRIRERQAGRGMGLSDLTPEAVKDVCNERSYGRGRTYYRTGRIASIEWEEDRVIGEVRGMRRYKVEVLDKSGSLPYHCTCPYDWGGACKHVVAVLLHMLDHGDEMIRTAREARAEIEAMLEEVSPRYMSRFLAGEMARDPSVAKRFGEGMMWNAAPGADHRRKIDALFSRARSRGPRGGEAVEVDLGPFVAAARRFEKAGEHGEAARVYGQIADAIAANAGKSEAYDGALRESIRGAGECAARIKGGSAREARARIRGMLDRYRAGDARFRADHEAALWAACGQDGGLRHLLAAVEPHVPKSRRGPGSGEGGLTRKERLARAMGRRMLGIKAAAMDGLGDGDAAEKLVSGHAAVHWETYEVYAGRLLRAGQAERAARAALEGIDRFGDDDGLVGIALEALGEDKPKRRALLERLYADSRNPDRLELLRKESDDWPAARARLISGLEGDKKRPEHLLDLLVDEGMYKRALRSLVGLGNTALLGRYRESLGGRFPKSYLVAYQYGIERDAGAARSGLACRKVAERLAEMAAVPAENAAAKARELEGRLRKKYKDRQMLADALDLIEW